MKGLTAWPPSHDPIKWSSPYDYKENGGRTRVAWRSKDPDGIILTRHTPDKPRLLAPPGFRSASQACESQGALEGTVGIDYHAEAGFWKGLVHGSSQSPTRKGLLSPPRNIRSPNYSRY